jgi:hypothetical protein
MTKHSMGFTGYVEIASTVTDSATIVSLQTDVPIGVDKNGQLITQTLSANGVSKRHATDKFNAEVAIKLAYSRAFATLAKKLAKQGNGLVKCADDNRAVNEARSLKKGKKKKSKQVRELVAHTSTR